MIVPLVFLFTAGFALGLCVDMLMRFAAAVVIEMRDTRALDKAHADGYRAGRDDGKRAKIRERDAA